MSERKEQVDYPSDREMVFTRVFDAPREMVWKAWTDPKIVALWWGPQGFTNTIHEMEVRVVGIWRLTMHGPDGTDYPNRIEYLEVVRPSRMVYHHGEDDANPHMFHVTTDFINQDGKTKIVMRMLFKTPEECEATKAFAVEGHNSTMNRLDDMLAKMKKGEV